MCLAPCFKGCSDEEYAAEVARVKAFWDTGGESLVREITLQREAASSRLAFEEASAIHSRLEKLEPVIRQLPGIVRRIDELSGVIVQRSTEAECVNLFVLQRGTSCDPLRFAIRGPEHAKSQSMEARVQEAIAGAQAAEAASATERMEHLAILKRWYFRGKRAGELFLTDQGGALPMRRLVRGISRVYRGEKEDGVVPATSEQTRGE
jgi:excinuclease UvrABC nuclease subunit